MILKNPNYTSYDYYSQSLKQRVFKHLDKNPLYTPKALCKLLDLSYARYHQTVANCKTFWKYNQKSGVGSKRSTHRLRVDGLVPESVERDRASEVGWVQSRNRNKTLFWKDSALGRVEWFTSGKLLAHIKKPWTVAVVKTLLQGVLCDWAYLFFESVERVFGDGSVVWSR